MECHACGRSVEREDRFCNGCGTSLQGVTDTTQVVATVDETTEDNVDENVDENIDETTEESIDENIDGVTDESETGDLAAVELDDTPVDDLPAMDPTELIAIDRDETWGDEPAWAPTGPVPTQQAPPRDALATTDLPATEPITEVWMRTAADDPVVSTPYDFTEREPVAITGRVDAQPAPTATMPVVHAEPAPPRSRFAFNLILFIGLLAGIVSLVALFADVISITSDARLVQTADTPPEFRTGTWIVDDLADNLSIAGLIAVVAMVAGGVASGFHWRWGSGLAGGAGLAMAGLAAVTVGLAQFPIDTARAFARVPTEDPFVLTITRDLGYWLMVAAGALGVVLFFASINDALGDRRPGLNPWIAALGALAIVVAAAGPLIPENQAIFSDNWYLIEGPGEASALLLVGRLVQLGLFLIGGVVGFLSVRRWGLGVAFGAALPGVWLVVSTLVELTDRPVGLGFGNPGAVDMHVHGVTIIGTSAVLAMLVLGAVGAYDQGVREGR